MDINGKDIVWRTAGKYWGFSTILTSPTEKAFTLTNAISKKAQEGTARKKLSKTYYGYDSSVKRIFIGCQYYDGHADDAKRPIPQLILWYLPKKATIADIENIPKNWAEQLFDKLLKPGYIAIYDMSDDNIKTDADIANPMMAVIKKVNPSGTITIKQQAPLIHKTAEELEVAPLAKGEQNQKEESEIPEGQKNTILSNVKKTIESGDPNSAVELLGKEFPDLDKDMLEKAKSDPSLLADLLKKVEGEASKDSKFKEIFDKVKTKLRDFVKKIMEPIKKFYKDNKKAIMIGVTIFIGIALFIFLRKKAKKETNVEAVIESLTKLTEQTTLQEATLKDVSVGVASTVIVVSVIAMAKNLKDSTGKAAKNAMMFFMGGILTLIAAFAGPSVLNFFRTKVFQS